MYNALFCAMNRSYGHITYFMTARNKERNLDNFDIQKVFKLMKDENNAFSITAATAPDCYHVVQRRTISSQAEGLKEPNIRIVHLGGDSCRISTRQCHDLPRKRLIDNTAAVNR